MSPTTPHPIRFRIDSKTDKTLDDLAKSWGVSRSDVIRMAIRHGCLCENNSAGVWNLVKTQKTHTTTIRLDLKARELLDMFAFEYEPRMSRSDAVCLAVKHIALCESLTWPLGTGIAPPTKAHKRRYGVK